MLASIDNYSPEEKQLHACLGALEETKYLALTTNLP